VNFLFEFFIQENVYHNCKTRCSLMAELSIGMPSVESALGLAATLAFDLFTSKYN